MKIALALAALVVTGTAFADGPAQQYDQAIVNKMSLDPNEALVNDDGAQEDPHAKMTEKARAFRNGIINGRRMQKEEDESAYNPPPLPSNLSAPRSVAEDDQSLYTSIPPQPRVRPPYGAQYGSVPPALPGAYGGVPSAVPDGRYPAPVTNVYVQAPQPQYDDQPQPIYAQPPQVYTPPPVPPTAYVYVQGVPPVLSTGYWPRGYTPVYPQAQYYVSRGYYRRSYGY